MQNSILLPSADISDPKREFLPQNFELTSWESIEPYFNQLINKEISSKQDLTIWLKNWSELDAFLSENFAWRYIRLSCDTENEKIKEDYQFFLNEIKPKTDPFTDALNKKFIANPFLNTLDKREEQIFIRSVKNEIEIFREENVPLSIQAENLAQEYADLVSQMMIHYDGIDYTLSQAAKFLSDSNREVRKVVYELISNRRKLDADRLNIIFDELVKLRTTIAKNAGFENFRDYKYKSLGRFDYTVQEVKSFKENVAKIISPLAGKILLKKKATLGLEDFRPYDSEGEVEGKKALQPYQNADELIDKTIEAFDKLNPILGKYLGVMKSKGYLDLDSRKGKSPGGYNYPLDEVGIPFIFMNSSGKHRDLVTMFHEGGHAIHSFVTRELELNAFRHTTSEVAELASMSMELISMDYWALFYKNPEDLNRAKREQLEGIIEILPWIALVDDFQDHIYLNPNLSIQERMDLWVTLYRKYHPIDVEWEGYEAFREIMWQKQLHIYEVPFYYIEYGIAQLGALGVWMNYKENPQSGLENYLSALKLGYTKTVPEIYETAGIKFDFSAENIQKLADFTLRELENL